MQVAINNDWRISSDRYQWILQRKTVLKNRKSGEAYDHWTNFGYYGSLISALSQIPEAELRLSDIRGVKTALETIERLTKDIERAFQPAISVDRKALKGKAA